MKSKIEILLALKNILPKIGVSIKDGAQNIARFPKSEGADPFKPNFLDVLVEQKGKFGDARRAFEENAQYIMSESTEKVLNFYNNIIDYIQRGGKTAPERKAGEIVDLATKQKMTPAKTEAVTEQLGLPKDVDVDSPMGGLLSSANRLKALVDEIEGISPEMRKKMDAEEVQALVTKMKEAGISDSNIKDMFKEFSGYSTSMLKKEVAPRYKIAANLGAKTPGETQMIKEIEEMKELYRPDQFRENLTNDDVMREIRNSLEKDLKLSGKFTEDEIDDILYSTYGGRAKTPDELINKLDFELLENKQGFKFNKEFYENAVNKYIKPMQDVYPDDLKFANGGRVGMRLGGLLSLLKLAKKGKDIAEEEEIFRKGPITSEFLEKVSPSVFKNMIRTRDASGEGGYGLYKSFDEMPAGLKAAELIKRIRTKDGGIDYERAEAFIGKELKGNETIDELIEMIASPQVIEKADGGVATLFTRK